jgi:hypothetical protein
VAEEEWAVSELPVLDPLLRYSAVPPIDAVHRLLLAMGGIATCATACGCCEMHRQIAKEAVQRFFVATGIDCETARSAEASKEPAVSRI